MPFVPMLPMLTMLFLAISIWAIAGKRPAYSHLRHTISELGETGSAYQKAVSFRVFLPVGLSFLAIAGLTYAMNAPAAAIAAAMGAAYSLSAFFPCDPGTPVVGSWKNTIHNIVGGGGYAIIANELNGLETSPHAAFHQVTFAALCAFLALFITGLARPLIGLAQRVAEACILVSLTLLLI